MDPAEIIRNLFIICIKRLPTEEEMKLHLDRYTEIHNSQYFSVRNEFINSYEARTVQNHEIVNHDISIKYVPNYSTDNRRMFNPVICVNNDKKILTYSNSYLLLSEIRNYLGSNYEDQYKIYSAITNNYLQIINSTACDNIINDECVYLCNAFMDSNIGHCCSHNFSVIEKMYQDNILDKKIVIINDIYPNMLKLLLIFFDESQIIKLEKEVLYKFTNIYIYYPTLFNIEKNPFVINTIISFCNDLFKNNTSLLHKKVLMVKKYSAENNSQHYVQNITDEMSKYCELNNVMIIEPEKMDIYELIFILQNADVIITSRGAISYTHMIYFNKNAKLYLIDSPYFYSNQYHFAYPRELNIFTLREIVDSWSY